jgi:hypothetical protein
MAPVRARLSSRSAVRGTGGRDSGSLLRGTPRDEQAPAVASRVERHTALSESPRALVGAQGRCRAMPCFTQAAPSTLLKGRPLAPAAARLARRSGTRELRGGVVAGAGRLEEGGGRLWRAIRRRNDVKRCLCSAQAVWRSLQTETSGCRSRVWEEASLCRWRSVGGSILNRNWCAGRICYHLSMQLFLMIDIDLSMSYAPCSC